MPATPVVRERFRSQFRIKSGYKIAASFVLRDGLWHIDSIGGVSVPTALLPFSVKALVISSDPFHTLEEAKAAVKAS